WRGGLYAGIGPGAHGRVARNGKVLATQTTLSPEVWLSKVQHTPGSATTWEAVPDPERATEYMMMALRLREGADVSHYATLSGTQIPQDTIDGLVGDGFLTRNGSIIAATQRGRPVLNALIRELLVSA
ncbi:MAG: coproporphyrinogen III oxidase, partial [Pseudomonadota bacterium]